MKAWILPLLPLFVFCAACSDESGPGRASSAPTTTDAVSADAVPADATEESPAGYSQRMSRAPGQITAGEWRDADHWDFWQSLMKEDIYGQMPEHWQYNVSGRIQVKTTGSDGRAVADVPVRLFDAGNELLWEGRSDRKGMVSLFPYQQHPQASRKGLRVQAGDGPAVRLPAGNGEDEALQLTVSARSPEALLDAAFVMDATGSMGDEMDYLKAELTDVIRKAGAGEQGLEIRTAAVFYRDEDDDYLTRKSEFTEDVSETAAFIRKQSAAGGGDFPEAVHAALDVALNDLEWSDHARARLLFLVLDAPPHHDADIIRKVNTLVALAAKKGVRIIPVVSSGIDKETEFLMRYMAIATGGTYVFLTDDSGIGNSHLQPTIGKYEVEYLNALLVRVIGDYAGSGRLQ